MGFSRQGYWNGLPLLPLEDLPDPGIWLSSPWTPRLTSGFFYHWATWEVPPHGCTISDLTGSLLDISVVSNKLIFQTLLQWPALNTRSCIPIGGILKVELLSQKVVVVVVQSLGSVRLFSTPWTAACQASLSFTVSWSLLKFMSLESVMLSNHLIPCQVVLLPSILASIRVFSNESALGIR